MTIGGDTTIKIDKNSLQKFLFALILLLVTVVSNAQVGIGTNNPNPSSQLDIVADDKGILIPKVPLISTTDTITITNGNVESLLVYNTNTQNDITPGFYYWYNNKWNRLTTADDFNPAPMSLDSEANTVTFTNPNGTELTFGVNFQSNITYIENNGDGTYSYFNEEGQEFIINTGGGQTGLNGLSAYEIAVQNGFTGTETEWLASLQGTNGIDGIDGLSAYEIAVQNGFTGTETEWLTSLQGADGQDGTAGLSAYEIAVQNGFVGTETEWLESLQGADGQDTNNWLENGLNTTVESTVLENGTEWKVNVATAKGATEFQYSSGIIEVIPATLGVVKEADINPTVKVSQQGELSVNLENLNSIKEISGTYNVLPTDAVLLGNASTADVTVILPSPENYKGKKYTIQKKDTNEDYFVNVYGNINGLTQLYTALPYSGWDLISDGTQWKITNKF